MSRHNQQSETHHEGLCRATGGEVIANDAAAGCRSGAENRSGTPLPLPRIESAKSAVDPAPGAPGAGAIDRYLAFLQAKVAIAGSCNLQANPGEFHAMLKPHQRDIACWAVNGGRRAIFASFGLGKTFMNLEWQRVCLEHHGRTHSRSRGLIIAPLGVVQEFTADAAKLGIELKFVRLLSDCTERGIYITNYETVRDGKLDPREFDAVSLDEASVLRGFGGTKTFREFMALIAGDDRKSGVKTDGVRYRLVATATPAPNEYIELLAYAAFLGVMDVGQAKTRFFKRNSVKADQLTLHPHKEAEFWAWLNSWAVFVQRPSDLGYDDTGYVLPPITIRWHEVAVDHRTAGFEKDGQGKLFRSAALGVIDAAREKRDSLDARVAKAAEIVNAAPGEHFILWHDLEAERHAIRAALPEVSEIFGSLDLETREQRIVAFSNGQTRLLSTKPELSGSGCNFQRHCHRAVYVGIGFKFNDFIQSIHRIQRFLQEWPVEIDIIYTESEREIRRTLEQKWEQHNMLVNKMSETIRAFGLNAEALTQGLKRTMGLERMEATGSCWTAVNNDCVLETARMEADSVHLILTSIPFSNQYEYSPSYNDFGHTDDAEHFWQQMDYLIPNLYRVLQPGRVCAIHVKDRICPGGVNGFGFQTVQPFSDECSRAFQKHGFALIARKTIVTDVVRENNQTYRLGWSEQCKDGSRMGAGMPEYLLVFRKPPTDRSNGYADVPVVKSKGVYSRGRWQLDAHGSLQRSSGNRHLNPDELAGMDQADIYRIWKDYSLHNVYDYEFHVKVCETVDEKGWLPSTFMLLPPASWSDEVWGDVTRMLTLNSSQAQKNLTQHICPLQFDICDRAITQYTNPGELVLDPFGGIGTVMARAIHLGRRGYSVELNPAYWLDSLSYAEQYTRKAEMPGLFDAIGQKAEAA